MEALIGIRALIRMGALTGMEALSNKNTFKGALIRNKAPTGRKALTRIITIS